MEFKNSILKLILFILLLQPLFKSTVHAQSDPSTNYDLIWNKRYNGSYDISNIFSIDFTNVDDDYIGINAIDYLSNKNCLIYILNKYNGNVYKKLSFGDSSKSGGRAIKLLSKNEFIFVGWTNSDKIKPNQAKGGIDLWIFRYRIGNGIIWEKRIGGSSDESKSVDATVFANTLYLSGVTYSDDEIFSNANATSDNSLYLLSVNIDNGDIRWVKTYTKKLHNFADRSSMHYDLDNETIYISGEVYLRDEYESATEKYIASDAYLYILNKKGDLLSYAEYGKENTADSHLRFFTVKSELYCWNYSGGWRFNSERKHNIYRIDNNVLQKIKSLDDDEDYILKYEYNRCLDKIVKLSSDFEVNDIGGDEDVRIAWLDTNFNYINSNQYGSNTYDNVRNMTIDANDCSIYIVANSEYNGNESNGDVPPGNGIWSFKLGLKTNFGEQEVCKHVKITPNPSNLSLSIKIDDDFDNEVKQASVEVFSINGLKVLEKELSAESIENNTMISNVGLSSSGMYIVKISINNNSCAYKYVNVN